MTLRIGRSHVEEIKGETVELSLIADMSQIPEVESIYKYQEGEHTTYFTILDTTKYQRDVHMQVYEVEYNVGRTFPEANISFECIPKLALEDSFLPVGIKKVYERESN